MKRLRRSVAMIAGVSAPARALEAAGANGRSLQASRRSSGDGVDGFGFSVGGDTPRGLAFVGTCMLLERNGPLGAGLGFAVGSC